MNLLPDLTGQQIWGCLHAKFLSLLPDQDCLQTNSSMNTMTPNHSFELPGRVQGILDVLM